jgi:hypothetical protein
VSGSPKKMIITDVETAESMAVQFNPVEVTIEGDAQYQRIRHPAGSFQRLSFEGKNNDVVSFELVFDSLAADDPFVDEWEPFLKSLQHPPDDPSSFVSAAPHEILLTWPGWIAIVGALIKCKEKVRRFAPPTVRADPVPTLRIFDVAVEESRRISLGAESVRLVPSYFSRYRFCSAITDGTGKLYLTNPVPFEYEDLPDNKVYVTVSTDTWESIADGHFNALADQLALIGMEPSHLYWVLCDFQPEPRLDAAEDPTRRIPQGSRLVLPSVSTVLERLFNEARRSDFEA